MDAPGLPLNEPLRLNTLRSLAILDTPHEERFDRITRIAQRLFDVPIALVSLVDAHRQWFKSCVGLSAAETSRDVSFCGHAILKGSVFVVEDTLADDRFVDNPLVTGAPDLRFYAGRPLVVRGQRIGTLCVADTAPRSFSAADRAILEDLARVVEHELGTAEMATSDELTGLCNRRGFLHIAQKLLTACCRFGQSAAVMMTDLDGFKAINDTLGHAAGDAALREMSACLLSTFRDSDLVARLGGDEFCVMMTGAKPAELDAVLARLDGAVASRNAARPQCSPLRYSTGVAWFDSGRHADLQAMLEEADRALYDDKYERRAQAEGEASPESYAA